MIFSHSWFLAEHWKIIKINALSFDSNSEWRRKTVSKGFIIGGISQLHQIAKNFNQEKILKGLSFQNSTWHYWVFYFFIFLEMLIMESFKLSDIEAIDKSGKIMLCQLVSKKCSLRQVMSQSLWLRVANMWQEVLARELALSLG